VNKTVVITGTASGFGRSSVQRFAAERWNVVATVRKKEDLTAHAGLTNVRTLLLDVDDEAADSAFAGEALKEFGQVHALVNNAGYYHMGPVEAGTMKQVHRQFQTNVFGLIAITKGFLPFFREQRSGVIVNISSISADQGYPYTAIYAAVAAFTEGLNVEMSTFGVTAKAIFPGQHSTRIFTKIDSAPDVPTDYQEGMKAFFGANASGSAPEVTSDVIFQGVTDRKDSQARYYSGPDAVVIPRVRQLLGSAWYWEEFRAANTGRPSALWTSLMPHGGDAVDMTI